MFLYHSKELKHNLFSQNKRYRIDTFHIRRDFCNAKTLPLLIYPPKSNYFGTTTWKYFSTTLKSSSLSVLWNKRNLFLSILVYPNIAFSGEDYISQLFPVLFLILFMSHMSPCSALSDIQAVPHPVKSESLVLRCKHQHFLKFPGLLQYEARIGNLWLQSSLIIITSLNTMFQIPTLHVLCTKHIFTASLAGTGLWTTLY